MLFFYGGEDRENKGDRRMIGVEGTAIPLNMRKYYFSVILIYWSFTSGRKIYICYFICKS